MRRSRPWIGWLPLAFIGAGMVNFLAGSTLGSLMALVPGWWARLGPVHGEINPYGWLTMLIYGMTYAVLSVSAGLRPPRPGLGWVQWALAEAGVLGIVAGDAAGVPGLSRVGWLFQALAPLVFLINILSAVRAKRRGLAGRIEIPERMRYLGPSDRFQATDRVGQRGTDIALMLFLVGVVWSTIRIWTGGTEAAGAGILVDYGWIAGTVLSVAVHLYPRFTDDAGIPRWSVLGAQGLWLLGVVLSAFGALVWPVFVAAGQRLMGVAFLLSAAMYLVRLPRRRRDADGLRRMPLPAAWAWAIAWWFAAILGLALLAGLSPGSLAAMHLLFLGWITTLVYAVGYALFPVFLEVAAPTRALAGAQVILATVGAAGMALAFALSTPSFTAALPFADAAVPVLFTIGGVCAWGAFAGFSLLWGLAWGCDSVHTAMARRAG
ncbi:hypothetical protein [Alicyclobacillus sp.]|uniref:hypothetical protein n=1 Tax=Alicyclobacillus sp. TaxID=61169 RepID=UPI0025BC9AE3|nr:hypothetical protein [Alicyclobacillus sp.]MCL6517208.1 hypothetical protein [Alicyclobacillus sp.]